MSYHRFKPWCMVDKSNIDHSSATLSCYRIFEKHTRTCYFILYSLGRVYSCHPFIDVILGRTLARSTIFYLQPQVGTKDTVRKRHPLKYILKKYMHLLYNSYHLLKLWCNLHRFLVGIL